jgi:hypothetical protein
MPKFKKDAGLDALLKMSDAEYETMEQLLGISLHSIPHTEELVPLSSINPRPDWQPRLTTDPKRLFQSISAEGLATPLKVSYHSDDKKYHVLQGRHRYSALALIETNNTEAWKRHGFDKGIPCTVYKDLSAMTELEIRTDEGRVQEPLANKVEAYNALEPHYEAGKTDKEISQRFWKIFADCCVSTSKRSELYRKYAELTTPKDFFNAVLNATRVHQQLFRYLYECPTFIKTHWKNAELGLKDKAGAVPVNLTNADIRELAMAMRSDLEDDKLNGFKFNYTKANCGPGVKTLYAEILESKKPKADAISTTPMTKAEKEKHIAEGQSQIEKVIFSAVMGNQNCKGEMPRLLNLVARFETTYRIDEYAMEQCMIAITKHGEKLPAKLVADFVEAINATPKTFATEKVEAKAPPIPSAPIDGKNKQAKKRSASAAK